MAPLTSLMARWRNLKSLYNRAMNAFRFRVVLTYFFARLATTTVMPSWSDNSIYNSRVVASSLFSKRQKRWTFPLRVHDAEVGNLYYCLEKIPRLITLSRLSCFCRILIFTGVYFCKLNLLYFNVFLLF